MAHYSVDLNLYNRLKGGISRNYDRNHQGSSTFADKLGSDAVFAKKIVEELIFLAREPELWDIDGENQYSNFPIVQQLSEPPWVYYARTQIGINEDDNCSDIVNRYHQANREYKPSDCEIPWCASFVGYCLNQTEFDAQLDAGAASYANPQTRTRATGKTPESYGDPVWGEQVNNPFIGAIGVYKNGNQYHVTFIIAKSVNGETLYALGGNQGDRVNITGYERSKFVAFMKPANYTIPEGAYTLPFRRSAAASTSTR
jgi:uncharacterized protein (TIGR02594 family)